MPAIHNKKNTITFHLNLGGFLVETLLLIITKNINSLFAS